MANLTEHLNHSDLRQRLEASSALIHEGQQAVPSLTEALQQSDIETQWRAAAVLGIIKAASAIPALVKRSDGAGYEVKLNCVWALGEIGDVNGVQPLMEIVYAGEEESPDIRYAAALALIRLGQSQALQGVLEDASGLAYRVVHAALITARFM